MTAIASFWSGCTVQIRFSCKALIYCICLLFMVVNQHAWLLDGSILCALCWLLIRGIGSNLNKIYYNAQSPVSQDLTPFHCSQQTNLASIPSLSSIFSFKTSPNYFSKLQKGSNNLSASVFHLSFLWFLCAGAAGQKGPLDVENGWAQW